MPKRPKYLDDPRFGTLTILEYDESPLEAEEENRLLNEYAKIVADIYFSNVFNTEDHQE